MKNVRVKKEYTPFPPAQQPSKVDLAIESGEYFLSKKSKEIKKEANKQSKQLERQQERQDKRAAAFIPPKEKSNQNKKDSAATAGRRTDPDKSSLQKNKNRMKEMTANIVEKLKRKHERENPTSKDFYAGDVKPYIMQSRSRDENPKKQRSRSEEKSRKKMRNG